MTRIFLSYSHSDGSAVAEHLFVRLQGAGYEVWKDDHSLTLGAHFAKEIPEKITEQDHFLVLLSKSALDSDWVQEEIETAKVYKRHIIPILIEELTVPPFLSTVHYLKMVEGVNDWFALHTLVNSLKNGSTIPRVFNASGHKEIKVEGVLVLGEISFERADLDSSESIVRIAKEIAETALPYLQKAAVGLVPHGHPAIASSVLAYLLGTYNQMPKLFWTSRNAEGTFGIKSDRYVSLQDIRDKGFESRSKK